MREIFTEIFENQPLDPMESARRGGRPPLRKRFYERAYVAETGEGGEVQILLDGKPVKTPARHALAAPTRPLADAIAAEWDAQKDVIDPASMPLTRLANAAIDAVRECASCRLPRRSRNISAQTCCAIAPMRPPVSLKNNRRHGIRCWSGRVNNSARVLCSHKASCTCPQPHEAIAAVRAAIPPDPWRLAAVSSITTLTGSALLALALAHDAISTPTQHGPPLTLTKTGKCRSGVKTTSRSNAALFAKRNFARQ